MGKRLRSCQIEMKLQHLKAKDCVCEAIYTRTILHNNEYFERFVFKMSVLRPERS